MAFYDKGLYRCRVQSTGMQMSKGGNERKDGTISKPAPMIAFQVTVLEKIDTTRPDKPGIPVSAQYDRTFREMVPEDDAGLEELADKLRHAGWTGMRLEELDSLEDKVVECWCRLKDDFYQGKATVKEEWKLSNPGRGGGAGKPLENDPRLAKKLNALLGSKLKARMPVASAQPQWAPEPPAEMPPAGEPFTPAEDDDVPF
jgi:hypothetical protein